MDPAMAGMPVDPAAAGGAPADPAAMAAEEEAGGAQVYDMIVQAVRQVMQEMGVQGGEGEGDGEEEKKEEPKKTEGTSSKIENLENMMGSIMTTLGIPVPGGEAGGAAEAAPAAGFGMDSGAPSAGENALPMPVGPLDPNASAMMGEVAPAGGMPMPPKMAGFKPLDDMSEVKKMAAVLKRIQATR
jgi:hypothetical protein